MKSTTKAAGALLAGAMLASTVAVAAPASAADGNRSLVDVLTSDGNQFDNDKTDYDLVTEAALAVLGAKPDSPVGVLADGNTPVTAFVPDDRAFRILVWNLTGTWYPAEEDVLNAAVSLGVDTVETVLLYHVIPGATLDAASAIAANGQSFTTAAGLDLTLKNRPAEGIVQIADQDPDYFNPIVQQPDINAGNKQIAHGLNLVLRPLNF